MLLINTLSPSLLRLIVPCDRLYEYFLQMLDRDKESRLSQFVIGLLRHIGIYLEGFRCIFTQNGGFKVHAGIQNNIILDFSFSMYLSFTF